MAYQNVGTPRFYVDYLLWRKTLGLPYIIAPEATANPDSGIYDSYLDSSVLQSTISLNPSNQITLYNYKLLDQEYIQLPAPPAIVHPTSSGQNTRYFAALGHNYASADSSINIDATPNPNDLVNAWGSSYDGFSIGTNYQGLTQNQDGSDEVYRIYMKQGTENLKVGCYSVGNYYDMPNAPNLSLTMNREYGGTKEFTTYNGGSMSNTMWSKPPKWGIYGAWELEGSYPALSRSGRRTWQLKFSYMDDGDLWGSNQMLSNIAENITTGLGYESGDIANSTTFNYDLLTDNNFFSQVWHKTLGMTLPMIFQQDNSNNNPDQFAIVKGVPNSLKATQSSPNVYDISLSIEEVW